MEEGRKKVIKLDETGWEVILDPYLVMPRRVWDLKSNRVIDFRIRMADFRLVQLEFPQWIPKTQHYPYFWAVTHAWVGDLYQANTTVNGHQWPVPLPVGVTLQQVRVEMLEFGGDYVWLDAVCLRQEAGRDSAGIKSEEWKIDVPTIGNIYIAAAGIVRYFNGLGRQFSATGWDSPRHWLKRAWTLQEIRPEAITHTGGAASMHRILETIGSVDGKMVTLRSALARMRKLIEDSADPTGFGCKLFDIVMSYMLPLCFQSCQ